ncbi:MAG: hypothetical protein KC478_14910 [Bacteriovoracaceae bacterium]|nr:hypothetical protein [Bacteriovoracaceae bacterium]
MKKILFGLTLLTSVSVFSEDQSLLSKLSEAEIIRLDDTNQTNCPDELYFFLNESDLEISSSHARAGFYLDRLVQSKLNLNDLNKGELKTKRLDVEMFPTNQITTKKYIDSGNVFEVREKLVSSPTMTSRAMLALMLENPFKDIYESRNELLVKKVVGEEKVNVQLVSFFSGERDIKVSCDYNL